jgi:branched-chain amino acid transport system substrate-binding protein
MLMVRKDQNMTNRNCGVAGAALTAALAAVLTLSACGGGAENTSAEGLTGDPVIIGVVEDTSGGSSSFSTKGVEMIKLAVDQVNAGELPSGIESVFPSGQRGIDDRPVEVITADDGNDPNRAVQATRQLISKGAAAVIFTSNSASAIQGRVVCEQSKVVCIASANVSADIVKQPNASFVFTIAPQFSNTAEVFTKIFKDKGYKSIAYVSDDGPTGSALVKGYQQTFEAAGFTTADTEVIGAGASDVTAQISAIGKAEPDVIFDMIATPAEDGLFLRESGRRLPDIPRWATNAVTVQPDTWEIAGSDIDGVKAVDNSTLDNSYTQEVSDLYTKKTGEDAAFWTALTHWDAVMLIKKAIEDAGSTEGSEVVAAMEMITGMPSAHGQDGYELGFSADNHNAATSRSQVPVVFEDAKPVPATDEALPQ